MSLNDEQRGALAVSGHLLIVAGPGTGKTRTLTARAWHKLRTAPRDPLVVVTFTRDAANEIRTRLTKILGRLPKEVRIGTFHSLAMEQLRRAGKMGRLLSPGEQRALIVRAWRGVRGISDFEEACRTIEFFKSDVDPKVPDSKEGWLFNAYQALLAEHRAMDFADLLLNAVRGMRAGEIAPLPARDLMIDEGQDSDAVQYEWARHHADAGANLTLVGDDDQSIYSWRRALGHQGMAQFEQQYRAARITVGTNYRCAPEILAAADRLIRQNTQRLAKTLRADRKEPGTVVYRACRDRRDEATAFTAEAKNDPGSWVCLARTNRMLDAVEAKLTAAGVPYYRVGSSRLWDRPHVGNYLATLRSMISDETIGLEQLLIVSGLHDDTVRAMRPVGAQRIAHAALATAPPLRERLENLARLVGEWKEIAGAQRWELLAQAIANWYGHVLVAEGEKNDVELAGATVASLEGTLAGRLAALQFPSRRERRGVALMTLHACKGLEFHSVWLLGLEEGTLPHGDGEVSEERRLCYVGMTRARQRLVLSSGKTGAIPSRFLREAGLLEMAVNNVARA